MYNVCDDKKYILGLENYKSQWILQDPEFYYKVDRCRHVINHFNVPLIHISF